MKSCVDHVVHRAIKPDDAPACLLYLPYDGFFENMLGTCDLTLYSPANSAIYEWPSQSWPTSLNWLPEQVNYVPNRIDIDGVIANWRKDQVFAGEGIADQFHLPLIMVDHELPTDSANTNMRKYVTDRLPKQATIVYPHDIVTEEWHYTDMDVKKVKIPYGFDLPDLDVERDIEVLCAADLHPADPILKEMGSCHPNVVTLGYNEDTTPYESLEQLKQVMLRSKIFVTVAHSTRPPFFAMMAAACGCAVVTNRSRWSVAVFEDQKTAAIINQPHEIKQAVKLLHGDPKYAQGIADAGRAMMEQDYSMSAFQANWADLIKGINQEVYIR